MGVFTEKTLLITGGTGSFGNAVLNRFLKTDITVVRKNFKDFAENSLDYLYKNYTVEHEYKKINYSEQRKV